MFWGMFNTALSKFLGCCMQPDTTLDTFWFQGASDVDVPERQRWEMFFSYEVCSMLANADTFRTEFWALCMRSHADFFRSVPAIAFKASSLACLHHLSIVCSALESGHHSGKVANVLTEQLTTHPAAHKLTMFRSGPVQYAAQLGLATLQVPYLQVSPVAHSTATPSTQIM